jgi:uncharacterized protein YkwD
MSLQVLYKHTIIWRYALKIITKMGCGLFFMSFAILLNTVHAKPINTDKDMTLAILHYVNEYRVQHRLKPLSMNTTMSLEARKHSQNMANHALPFGHQGFLTRIQRCFTQFNQKSGPGAENVAFNYKSAKQVVAGWIKSPGHLRNIRGNYNLTGIGIAQNKRGQRYFTQLFMRSPTRALVTTTNKTRHSSYARR